jgi:hypothetical protein
VADTPKRVLKQELEEANGDLEQLAAEAYQTRKSLLDQARKEELKASIWRQRIRVLELDRDYVGELYMKARHEVDKAVAQQDQDKYLQAHKRLVGLRMRYLNAIDLLQRLQADGPDSSARLVGTVTKRA